MNERHNNECTILNEMLKPVIWTGLVRLVLILSLDIKIIILWSNLSEAYYICVTSKSNHEIEEEEINDKKYSIILKFNQNVI